MLTTLRTPHFGLTVAFAFCFGAMGHALAQEPGIRALQRVEQSDPLLQINVEGQTATVQALAFLPDSSRLCSAGLDKVVNVWNADVALRDIRRTFVRERTIRWQVSRSLRGSLYALDVSPGDSSLAMGGYGTYSLGAILLVNPLTGELIKVLEGHPQTVRAVSYSADGQWLASIDVDGQSRLWSGRDNWTSRSIYENDTKTYGAEVAKVVQAQPKVRPIVIAGNESVVVPAYVGRSGDGTLRWKLQRISIANSRNYSTLDAVHMVMVSALAATPDGRLLASADLQGNVFVWDLTSANEPRRLTAGAPVLSLAFHPQGQTLAVGTAFAAGASEGQLQLWDLSRGNVASRKVTPGFVQACRYSPNGQRLAYSGGKDNEVFLIDLANASNVRRLGTGTKPVFRVAFNKRPGDYRVAWGTTVRETSFNQYGPLEMVFDPTGSGLGAAEPLNETEWMSADSYSGGWSAEPRGDGGLQLRRGGAPRGRIELDAKYDGSARSYCWIPDRNGRPYAIAVGTDVQNEVIVCRLAENGLCPVLRRFRGHFDRVLSVGVSRDLRYLVSGAADGTIMIWSLSAYADRDPLASRWGCQLRSGNELVVGELNPAGPLYRKGVRSGDVISSIAWVDDNEQLVTINRPNEMVRRLNESSWLTQIVFETSRGGQPRNAFQILPAWRPVATLFVSENREWAFWTPEGYYDASANGHKLFGWQVNRGLYALPDFYRADQFRRRLERPEVMERLLPAGNLAAAFQTAQRPVPANPEGELAEQISVTPTVAIVSPNVNATVEGSTTKVVARVRIPPGGDVSRYRVFANGVVGGQGRIVSDVEVDGQRELTLEWDANLPAEPKNLIQVLVSTTARTTAFADVPVLRSLPNAAAAKPRLFVLAAAVDNFSDKGIPELRFCVADSTAIVDALKKGAGNLYELAETRLLFNEQVTLANWRKVFQEIRQELHDVARPDDLLLIYLAGHGMVDEKTGEYYYISHDAKLENVLDGDFEGCVAWRDFELLSDIPCRKVAMLDTCHSGAVQENQLRHQLKAATRSLQEDLIITLTATSADEKAAEDPRWGHGGFTMVVLDGLTGKADRPATGSASADGLIALPELVRYVMTEVPKLTHRSQLFGNEAGRSEDGLPAGQMAQHPTAAPVELLDFVNIPLTRVAAPVATGGN
jgi:WD40 repeat protein